MLTQTHYVQKRKIFLQYDETNPEEVVDFGACLLTECTDLGIRRHRLVNLEEGGLAHQANFR